MKGWLERLLGWYFRRESLPYWCLLALDSIIVFASGVFVFWVFNRTGVTVDERFALLHTMLVYMVIGWIGFRTYSTYSGIVRYSSFSDLMRVAYCTTQSTIIALVYSFVMNDIFGLHKWAILSQTETITMGLLSMLLMWLVRVLIKTLYEVMLSDTRAKRVLIYGALSGGVGIAKNINTQKPRRFILRGFISHEDKTRNLRVMGRKVYNVNDDLADVVKRERIEAVLVSPLRVDEFRDNQEIQNTLIGAGCKIYMVQQVKEASVKDGHISEEETDAMQMKEVSVEDLLPRQQIHVDMKSIAEQIVGKRVLITGSAGSIGAEIVRQVASFGPSKMMLIDQAETPQHDIRLMMRRDFPNIDAEAVVTSISRRTRMEGVFSTFRPQYVFHAAAYKHVPMMEDNPSEAVMNNIYGTKIIADMSVKYGVEKFVMISTDKAVNPTNVMGCSKRICEIYVQSLNRELMKERLNDKTKSKVATQFVTTRFGNVLGSNGSVIPLFKEQIKNGGPVTVTDERIVRFFMLIPEACKLVLEAGTKGNGGEIFVFDMGKPVKIADLAKRMIALSGAKNVKIEYTGLREGEKLYEEVLNEQEGTKPTFHEKIRIAEVREYDYNEVSKQIDDLIEISTHYDNMATVKKMKEIVPEYKSNNSVYEQLDAK
ncbi:MAG: polysaccharide biosynthesis protein [Bacteroidaceae bacterium]|nr:polysaccharide biosynthesis protein [Bacteroidaceae bacterium]